MSQKPAYFGWVFIVPGLVALLATLVPGSVAAYVGLFAGCAGTGSVIAAWMSGLAAAWRARGGSESLRSAFFAAHPGRWAFEGLAVGSTIGAVLCVLALLGV